MQFSVIIPAKNEQGNIARCLESVLSVDWDPAEFEIMVVDNGSSDKTVEVADRFGVSVHLEPDLSIAGLRNFGAGKASGEILSFIDADCTVDRGWLREASRYLSRTEIVCFGSPPGVPPNATWVQSAWFLVRRKQFAVGETDWLESMNMFVRREVFCTCGGFDETLVTCEDYDFSLRMKKVGLLVSDNRIIATHYGEAPTLTRFFHKELWRGKSSAAGILQHGLVLSEIPSLIAPVLHCLLLPGIIVCLIFFPGQVGLYLWGVAFWQWLLLMKSMRKQWPVSSIPRVLQLFCLLNVYLVARGAAIFLGNKPDTSIHRLPTA